MDKVKVNSGSSVNLGSIFDKLQNYIKSNLNKRFLRLFSKFGTINSTNSTNVITSGLKLVNKGSTATPSRFSILPGQAILTNGEQITLTTELNLDLSTLVGNSITTNTFYLIKLRFTTLGVDPVPVVNSFVYDSTGQLPYSQKYSAYEDSFIVSVSAVSENNPLYLNNIGADEVGLGILKTNSLVSTKIETGAFTFNSKLAVDGVIDLRYENTLKISKDLLNEFDVVLKDRDSIDDTKINGSVEVTGYLKGSSIKINGDDAELSFNSLTNIFKFITLGSGDNSLIIQPITTNSPIKVTDKNGNIIAYIDTANKKVGINKTPNETLDILGTLKASGVISSDDKIVGTDFEVVIGNDHTSKFTFNANDTKFDFYAKDNASNDGGLNLLPITNNRPISIFDKDGNIIFNIDTANKKIGVNKTAGQDTFDVLGTLNVSGAIKSQGRYVMLQPIDVLSTSIKNFRIIDVYGTKLNNIDPSMSGQIIQSIGGSNYLNVKLKWGWDDVIGTGGLNSFTITSSTLNVIQNELVNYYIYIPSIQTNLRITANTATTSRQTILTVAQADETAWNGININTTSESPAIIHSNADEYIIKAIPKNQTSGLYIEPDAVTSILTKEGFITKTETVLSLLVGTAYKIKIMAKKGTDFIEWLSLGAGSYNKYNVTQNYGDPFIVKHPVLSNTGISVTAESTTDGARVYISGDAWNFAEQFGCSYSYDKNPAAVSINTNGGLPTISKEWNITGTKGSYIYVKVWAYIAGQIVGVLPSVSQINGENYDASCIIGKPDILAPSILNYRIYDITGANQHNHLKVKLKWGWDTLVGTIANGVFTVTSGLSGIAANQLKGQFVYIPGASKNLVIVGNTATTNNTTILNIKNTDGTAYNDTVTVPASNPAWIHQNAEEYTIMAIPVVNGVEVDSESIEQTIKSGTNIVTSNSAILTVNYGVSYKFKIKAKRETFLIGVTDMNAGSFTKYSVVNNYTMPYTVTHPQIPNDGNISISAGVYNFNVSISGWTDAEEFEVVYGTASVSFDSSFPNIISTTRNISISANSETTYYIKARPLIAGKPVGLASSEQSIHTGTPTYLGEVPTLQVTSIYGANRESQVWADIIWGVTGLTAVGTGINSLRLYYNAAQFELNNLYLYSTITGNLRIQSNSAYANGYVECNVEYEDGSAWNGTGVNISNAILHQNADMYDLYLAPIDNNITNWSKQLFTRISTYSISTITDQIKKTILVDTNKKYEVRIFAYKNGITKWRNLTYTMSIPNILDDGTLTVTTGQNGFTMRVDGWATAEKYQFAYTTDNGGVNWSNPAHVKDPVASTTYSVSVPTSGTYYCAVRPLIGGQVVQNPLTKTVDAGAGGNLPLDEVIYSGSVNVWTGSSTIFSIANNTDGSIKYISSQTLTEPAGGGDDSITLTFPNTALSSSALRGSIMTIGSSTYVVTDLDLANTYAKFYVKLLNGTYIPQVGNTFMINTTKSGRQLAEITLTKDYKIKKITANIRWSRGSNSGVIRVYQKGYESDADSLIIPRNTYTTISTDADCTIKASNGDRILVIDAYDPGGSYNLTEFIINLTINAIPI